MTGLPLPGGQIQAWWARRSHRGGNPLTSALGAGRQAQIAHLLPGPVQRVSARGDDAVHQQRRSPATRHAMFAVAGNARVSGRIEPALELPDHLQHRPAGAGAEDTFVDQQASNRPRTRRWQAAHRVVLPVQFRERQTRLILGFLIRPDGFQLAASASNHLQLIDEAFDIHCDPIALQRGKRSAIRPLNLSVG